MYRISIAIHIKIIRCVRLYYLAYPKSRANSGTSTDVTLRCRMPCRGETCVRRTIYIIKRITLSFEILYILYIHKIMHCSKVKYSWNKNFSKLSKFPWACLVNNKKNLFIYQVSLKPIKNNWKPFPL